MRKVTSTVHYPRPNVKNKKNLLKLKELKNDKFSCESVSLLNYFTVL